MNIWCDSDWEDAKCLELWILDRQEIYGTKRFHILIFNGSCCKKTEMRFCKNGHSKIFHFIICHIIQHHSPLTNKPAPRRHGVPRWRSSQNSRAKIKADHFHFYSKHSRTRNCTKLTHIHIYASKSKGWESLVLLLGGMAWGLSCCMFVISYQDSGSTRHYSRRKKYLGPTETDKCTRERRPTEKAQEARTNKQTLNCIA
jgi:hypothetical protein